MLIEMRSGRAPQYWPASVRRQQMLVRMPWGQFLALTGLVLVVAAAAWWQRSYGAAAFTAVLLVYLLVWTRLVWRRTGAALSVAQPLDRHWTITDHEIRVTGGGSTRVWRWAAVTRVEVRDDVYLFRQEGGIGFDLPRDALTETQDNELQQFLRHRGLLA